MNPEPYIPLRLPDLIEVLLNEAGTPEHPPLDTSRHEAVRRQAAAIHAHIEASHRQELNDLKDAYAPFDPDIETLRIREFADDAPTRLDALLRQFATLLERGSFHRMTRAEIEATMQGTSYWGIEMDVCWDVFDRVDVFVRGRGHGLRTRRPWWRFFRMQEVEVATFRRVVLVFRQRPHKRLGRLADTSHVFIKIFKDIPTMDIEMMLPGTRLRMPKLERGKLGGTALGGIGWVGVQLASKVSIAGVLSGSVFALATPLVIIAAYGYKTIFRYRVSKRTYLLQLAESLYYQSLDANAGVLYRLYDEATEQETRQTLLAWYFLWRFAGPEGWTADELDAAVELDLERRVGAKIEVNTEEALKRLKAMNQVRPLGERFVAQT